MYKITDYDVLSVSNAHTAGEEVIDYGVKMVGAPLEWPETRGAGIKVGIIDTGICKNHPDLKRRICAGANFTGESKDFEDDNGHGTHVAGIVAAEKNGIGVVGVVPEADLYIAKAFDQNGYAPSSAIKKSIRWMIDQGVDVINMSFSSKEAESDYHDLMKEGYKKGIVFVCAAGNNGNPSKTGDTIGYPARFDQSIAVTAVDINKEVTDFSSGGPGAEICAAGKDIYSTYLNNGYAKLSGTSMATPLITGSVAILQAKAKRRYGHKLNPDEIRLLLHMYADDLGRYGRDSSYGYGLFTFGRICCSEDISSVPEKQQTTAKVASPRIEKPRYDLLDVALTAGLILAFS